jgi:hypothetical protein
MNSKQRILTGLMALALLITMAPVNKADAGIVVRGSVSTPHISVRVNTGPTPVYRNNHLRPLPAQRCAVVIIDKQDRRIARRLASYTGHTKRELLQMRRNGYTWQEIGSWLNLRPQVVRAAYRAESWERFLHGGRPVRVVRCGNH